MGKSVTSGASATLIPSFRLCLIDSAMTSVSKGPGEIPAVKPNIAPVSIKEVINDSYNASGSPEILHR